MRLVTFEVETVLGRTQRLGAIAGLRDDIVDLNSAFAVFLHAGGDEPTPQGLADLRVPPHMIGWLEAGSYGKDAAIQALRFSEENPDALGIRGERIRFRQQDVRLLAPLPRPTSFRAFSIYDEHMSRAHLEPGSGSMPPLAKGAEYFTNPIYYKGNCDSIRGPEDPVPFPYYTTRLDLEIEVGIVVGRHGRNLSVEDAESYISGFTILVDSSCRDGYSREPFGPTKRKDFHTAIGPYLVTPDEVDIQNLACSITVDGEVWFEGTTAAPHAFSPAQLVAYASDNEAVQPGDLLATGTIGFGCSMDHHRWIKVGQTAVFGIEGLGEISLPIVPGEHVVNHVGGMTGLLNPRLPA